jgi:hypothetical protein
VPENFQRLHRNRGDRRFLTYAALMASWLSYAPPLPD